jgi:hypothetical protein
MGEDMSSAVTASATVWTNPSGIPERLVWAGRRYRVSDRPTALESDLDAVTHPLAVPVGWRFQGTDDEGVATVFDVLSFDDGHEWHVVRTYR